VAVSRRSRLSVLALSATLTAGLAGCSVVSPIMTAEDYEAGDGTMIVIDRVRALNLMIVTEAEGESGILLGAVSNRDNTDHTVAISLDGIDVFSDTVTAETTFLLEEGEPVIVDSVPGAPGSMVDVAFSVSGAGSQTESVPVVDGTLPGYAEVLEEHADALENYSGPLAE